MRNALFAWVVVLVTPGLRVAQTFDECLRIADDFAEIAEMLRMVEIRSMGNGSKVESTPTDAWPLQCVVPWELPPNETRWVGAPTYLGSYPSQGGSNRVQHGFKSGEMLSYVSRVRSVSDGESILHICKGRPHFGQNTARLLIDGNVAPMDSYVFGCENESDGVVLALATRLYLPAGSHHVVVFTAADFSFDIVLAARRGSLRFASFWVDMEPNDGPMFELRARELAVDARAERSGKDPFKCFSQHVHRDYRFVTCCTRFGGLYHHTADDEHSVPEVSWISNGDIDEIPEKKIRVRHDVPIVRNHSPYEEWKCPYVWADAILFSEFQNLRFVSHYLMEFLSNLFFILSSRESDAQQEFADSGNRRQTPLFIIRQAYSDTKPDVSSLPPYHMALWPMLSGNDWIDWNDVLGMVHKWVHMPSGGPSMVCFRRLHILEDYNMTMGHQHPDGPQTSRYWRKYRDSLWAHLRVPSQTESAAEIRNVLFLRRTGSRRLLNHDEIAAMLQANGFDVRSITPEWYPLSVVASAVVQASLLIGINSGAYNAVFLPTGCAVLELAPHLGELYFSRMQPWLVGFEGLGVHHLIYACPHLYTLDIRGLISRSTDASALTALGSLGMKSPIVVSLETILELLNMLAELVQEARESSSEVGGSILLPCRSWEFSHTQNWTPCSEHSRLDHFQREKPEMLDH
jgi:hypothetical protein